MTLIAALKTGLSFRRLGRKPTEINSINSGWIRSNHDMYQFTKEDLLADDWEVLKPYPDQITSVNQLVNFIKDIIKEEKSNGSV